MPSDEFERSSGNEESTFMLSKVSLGTVEEQGAFGGIHEGQSPQLTDGSPQVSIDGSGRRDEDAGKAIQDLVIQPVNGPHTSVASNVLNSVDASISSSQTSLHPAPSSVNVAMHSSYGKAVTSTVSATPDWLHTDASPSTSPSWNLLDTSAYLWLGYVNGRSNQLPRSVPSPMPGWSSLMKGSPLTPPMINVLVSTPASSQPPQFVNAFADHAASTLSSLFLSFALVINSFSHAVSPPSHPNHTSYSTTTHPTLHILLRISIIHIPTRPVSPSKLKCPSPPFSL
uniref:Uncharacterized protein n=1 Tax=Vitis vinifera TaxID=29760 RepID=F6I483_VITVI